MNVSSPVPFGSQPGRPVPDLRWPIELMYWAGADVTFSQSRGALITNSPAAAGLFFGARAAGNARARRAASRLAQAQWRLAGTGEVILDERGIALNGSWGAMRLEYAEVASFARDRDALRITPVNYYSLLLRAADAENLASWYARLSDGKLWQQLATQAWRPDPQSPISYWEQSDSRFTFGVPLGWQPLTDQAYLSNVAKDAANNQQQLLFMLRRNTPDCDATADFNEITNPEVVRVLTGDPSYFEQDALRFAGVKAQRANGVVVNRPFVVQMNGERAAVIDTTMNAPHVRVRLREVYAGHGRRWFMSGFAVAHPADPQPYFDRFSPEFQTMIATWLWRY